MAPGAANKKVANGLVTLSSAAIVAVYAAGFMRTRAAAERLEDASNERRPQMPAPPTAGETRTPAPIEPPAGTVPVATALASPVMAKPEPPLKAAKPVAPAERAEPVKPVETTVAKAKAKTALAETAAAARVDAAVAPPSENHPAAQQPVAASMPMAAPVAIASAGLTESASVAPDEKPAAGLLMPKEKYKDGTYLGWGTSRHGDIQASVTIENGRITAAKIAQCWTRYSCSWVAHLPPQIVARQSPDCDYVSGATQSANAFYYAVVDALNKAK